MNSLLGRTLTLVIAGLPGVLSLLALVPEMPGVPRVALLANPVILLILAALVGCWAAPRCGFLLVSPTVRKRQRLGQALIGLALGVFIAAFDHWGRSLWQSASGIPASVVEAWGPASLLVGLLYGGVVEEVIMRWGLMSVLAAGLRAVSGSSERSSGFAISVAVVLAALVFAASHLPMLLASGHGLTASVVARTLLLNTVAGVAYGAIFARRDLVSAVVMHGATHLGFAATAVLVRA
jgi:hypothetical protein